MDLSSDAGMATVTSETAGTTTPEQAAAATVVTTHDSTPAAAVLRVLVAVAILAVVIITCASVFLRKQRAHKMTATSAGLLPTTYETREEPPTTWSERNPTTHHTWLTVAAFLTGRPRPPSPPPPPPPPPNSRDNTGFLNIDPVPTTQQPAFITHQHIARTSELPLDLSRASRPRADDASGWHRASSATEELPPYAATLYASASTTRPPPLTMTSLTRRASVSPAMMTPWDADAVNEAMGLNDVTPALPHVGSEGSDWARLTSATFCGGHHRGHLPVAVNASAHHAPTPMMRMDIIPPGVPLPAAMTSASIRATTATPTEGATAPPAGRIPSPPPPPYVPGPKSHPAPLPTKQASPDRNVVPETDAGQDSDGFEGGDDMEN
ncbi:hypothetical protein CXG81DRAFT_18028 [Caulochytrium protostelioides]|uniref:Uncharacterized protein n=1 Tax=Caulochytrium protostelioides TaxID=1555241 RepID=A0A4P9XA99_9FUNG|nr:hypothetical protein CXG81DRAFT_18028 [Caulochytrium protostelioides]|eukprot:RKP02278.1 hypothetical protein CXG81DRAFT_18028 [Caulochytrium protostelioides]